VAPIISDCTQTTVRGPQPSGDWACVFHSIGLGGTPPGPEDQAQIIVDGFSTTILTILTAQIFVADAAWVDLSSLTGASGVVSPTGAPVAGGGAGFGAPTNNALLVTWFALGTRTQRNGRSYLPGLDEDQVDTGGLLTSGYAADIQEQVDEFYTYCDSRQTQLVVNSKATGGTYEPRTITAGTISGKLATQRRRLRR